MYVAIMSYRVKGRHTQGDSLCSAYMQGLYISGRRGSGI